MAKTHTVNGVQYREVDRKAEIGDNIYIKKAFGTGGFYKVGDVLTVKRTDGDRLFVNENPRPIHVSEYFVLEPITSADIIVHDGKQYHKVDRPVREGDAYLILTEEESYMTVGKVYAINGIDSGGEPEVNDDDGDGTYVCEGNYAILEPVAPQLAQSALSALETELAATKAKVAEMEAQLEEVKRKEAEAQRLKVGDYVKVVDDHNRDGSKRPDVVIGEIRKITMDDGSNAPFRTLTLEGGEPAWFRAEALVRATDEEVAEAKRNLEEQRKQSEETARWAAIGRKVSEFKVGDVVRVIGRGAAGLAIGHVALVVDVDSDGDVELDDTNQFGRKTSFYLKRNVELIAPVEAVVNLRGGDAA